MPQAAGVLGLRLLAADALVGDEVDLRVLRVAVEGHRLVIVELAEHASERDLSLGRKLLAGEHDDEVVEPRLVDLGPGRLVDGPAEVNTGDGGAECMRQAADLDGHERSPVLAADSYHSERSQQNNC